MKEELKVIVKNLGLAALDLASGGFASVMPGVFTYAFFKQKMYVQAMITVVLSAYPIYLIGKDMAEREEAMINSIYLIRAEHDGFKAGRKAAKEAEAT